MGVCRRRCRRSCRDYCRVCQRRKGDNEIVKMRKKIKSFRLLPGTCIVISSRSTETRFRKPHNFQSSSPQSTRLTFLSRCVESSSRTRMDLLLLHQPLPDQCAVVPSSRDGDSSSPKPTDWIRILLRTSPHVSSVGPLAGLSTDPTRDPS